jgi:hypothetical protein
MTILRVLIASAFMAGCLGGPVAAQQRKAPTVTPNYTEEIQRRKDAEVVDREYKAALERTRKEQVVAPATDPWGGIRGSDDTKTKR